LGIWHNLTLAVIPVGYQQSKGIVSVHSSENAALFPYFTVYIFTQKFYIACPKRVLQCFR